MNRSTFFIASVQLSYQGKINNQDPSDYADEANMLNCEVKPNY